MRSLNAIDLSSYNMNECGRYALASVYQQTHILENDKVGEVRHLLSEHRSMRQEVVEIIDVEACSTGSEGGSSGSQSCLSSRPAASSAIPFSRKFWKAGNFEVGERSGSKAEKQDGRNQMRVHPIFLHSNATSHKWVFGAIADLLDNAFDEVCNGATFVWIDKISNPRNGSPALLIQDDGGGMNPETFRRCMSFGFSDKKMKHTIGQYGNGFKTGCMRLGADAIVFTRHMNMSCSTLSQSIGLLSYTFLRKMGYERMVVPMVDYEFRSSTKTFGPILEHTREQFASNLSTLLEWSPYITEEELLKQFDDVGRHGTKVVIYNLWLNNDGAMELDFDSDPEDIHINGHPKKSQRGDCTKSNFHQHVANRYHYSLRAYLSILYLRLPQCFNVILRGHTIEHHNVAKDLKFPEVILYRPQSQNAELVVVITIGFVKEAPCRDIHGYCIYHRNRLILPFWNGRKGTSHSVGRGVVGVLEANFIEPTHNKQDFEKTSLFHRLDDRLKLMTNEYWSLHRELIGYKAARRNTEEATQFQDIVVPKRKRSSMNHTRSPQGSNVKRQELNPPETDAMDHGESLPEKRVENQVEHSQTRILMQANLRLQSKLVNLEKVEKELEVKVRQIRSKLLDAQLEYQMLLLQLDLPADFQF